MGKVYKARHLAFNEIRAIHVVEHLPDTLRVMEEIHRITSPGATRYCFPPERMTAYINLPPNNSCPLGAHGASGPNAEC